MVSLTTNGVLTYPLFWFIVLSMFKWVRVKKFAELTGYTVEAVRCKIKKGVWLKDVHWCKAPDDCIFMNLETTARWIERKG